MAVSAVSTRRSSARSSAAGVATYSQLVVRLLNLPISAHAPVQPPRMLPQAAASS